MKNLWILALGLATQFALADDGLEGAYERVSLTNTRTGESPEAANRRGLLIMADGHYSMMTMQPSDLRGTSAPARTKRMTRR